MLRHRLISGISIAIIILAALFFLPAWAHLLVLLAVFAFAQMEFGGMIKRSGHSYDFLPTTLCGLLYLVFSAAESPAFIDKYPSVAEWRIGSITPSGIILVLTPAILLARGVFRRKIKNAMETFALSYAGFWYVAVLPAFIIRISYEWETYPGDATNYTGRIALMLFILLVKIGDTGAYFTGMRFGKRKLIPEISPKKTVEGLAGAYAYALAVSLIVWGVAQRFGGKLCDLNYPLIHALILPFLLTTTGVIGDLAESLIKRSVNIKDSGTHVPGMGGILDILDSLLFSAPVAYLYFVAFLK
ncbi:MAG: phosphatidate cytidylyltransferase [Kiritimatiellaeota bacterium]|nr:phosphatidate cytidylyltransferase [Kiritimatiellota bacterium]